MKINFPKPAVLQKINPISFDPLEPLPFDSLPAVKKPTVQLHGRNRKRCGAKNLRGTSCMCKVIPGKQRCKFHGGMSTGPKTPEGRQLISQAAKARWRAHREAKAQPESTMLPGEAAVRRQLAIAAMVSGT